MQTIKNLVTTKTNFNNDSKQYCAFKHGFDHCVFHYATQHEKAINCDTILNMLLRLNTFKRNIHLNA